MTTLRKELPTHIYWLTETVEKLVKPAAFLVKDNASYYKKGMSKMHGTPDLPSDAPWVNQYSSHNWDGSPYDGESFWAQINLEDIPNEVRKAEWPTVGLVWIFIDLKDDWSSRVEYDARPVSTIPLINLDKTTKNTAYKWVLSDTVPECTEELLPEIASVPWMVEDYEEWLANYYYKQPSNIQLGGWINTMQQEYATGNDGFVCAFENQEFGDCGSIYLYYKKEKGFFVKLETA